MISICFVGDRNIYMKRICNYLSGENYKIYLICRNEKGIDYSEFENNIEFYTLKSNRLYRKLPEIYRYLKRINPSFLHFQYLTKDVILSLLVFMKYKIILTPWGSDLNIFSRNYINRFILNLGFIASWKIQVLSEGMKKTLTKKFLFIDKNKIKVLSWGIDYDRFSIINQEGINHWIKRLKLVLQNFVILSYRNHKHLYNHHTLIRSLPLVIKEYPNVRCFFTRGNFDHEYLEQNKQLVMKLKLEEHVFFIEEWIPDYLLPSLIQLSDIAVSIPYHDGFPATLLEIMATKTVPVISGLDAYSSFFKDMENGRILKNLNDPVELARIITEIIENHDNYSKIFSLKNKIYLAENQDWNKIKTRLKELYDDQKHNVIIS